MGLVSIILLILFVISCIVLLLVVLIQDEGGEGLGGLFGGSSSTFGPRTGNVLTRFTSVVGAIFILGALALAWLNRSPETTNVLRKARIEKLKQAEKEDWWIELEETTAEQSETESAGASSPETTELKGSEAPPEPSGGGEENPSGSQ